MLARPLRTCTPLHPFVANNNILPSPRARARACVRRSQQWIIRAFSRPKAVSADVFRRPATFAIHGAARSRIRDIVASTFLAIARPFLFL